jgi:hypothetical protein
MTDANQIAERYIAVWNETDPARRSAMLAKGWSADATYADPLMKGEGHEEIGALIGAVQERFPGFRFALDDRVDSHGDNIRFSWSLGPDSDPQMIKGTDFAIIEDGRLKSVTGFLDKVPAAPKGP